MSGRAPWTGGPGWIGPGVGRARCGTALRRIPGLLRPPVDVYEPDPGSFSMLRIGQ